MSNRVAIVTGSNKGIGFAIVRALCKQFDGDVYLTSRNEERGREALKLLKNEGLEPKFHQLDIEDTNSVNVLKEYMEKTHGGVDVLVNNAGFAFKNAAKNPFDEQARVTIGINYAGTNNVLNAFMPIMKDNGRIVNVSSGSSTSALRGCNTDRQRQFKNPNITVNELNSLLEEFIESAKEDCVKAGFHKSAYGMSKLGMTVITRILSKEVGNFGKKGILMNCCCPGWIKTDMAGEGAPGTPDEGAITPTYLALLPPGATEPQGEFLKDKKVNKWY